MIHKFVVFTLVVVGVFTAARAPVPHCVAHPVLEQAPLSIGERLDVQIDGFFSGYNLDLTVASNNTFARLNKKLTQTDNKTGYYPNVISHHIEHNGNNWGKEAFILYQDMAGSIIFNFGTLQDQAHIPALNTTVIVTSDKNVQCFGAALLLDFGLAIIDCIKKTQDPAVPLENYFYYIDLATHKVSQVRNSMYVKYKTITKRTTLKYKDISTGYQYLLRVYPADGVNMESRGNTYMQIFSIRDPYDIQIMKVIDRTYLHISTLSIIDVKVYLGDIFFLDYINGLYRLDILRNSDVLITGRYIKDGFTRFSVYSDDLQNEVLIALANAHAVYEIDWSNIRDPVMVNKYSLMEHSHIKQLIINDLFVLVQSAANATNNTNPNFEVDYTWIFSRGARTYTNAYAVINHNSSKVALEFNKADDRLLAIDESGLYLYQIQEPILSLSLTETAKVGTNEDVILLASSSDFNTPDILKCQIKIKIYFVNNDDLTIYKQNYDTTSKFSLNYPGELHIEMDRYVMGPNITFNLVNTSAADKLPEHWVNKLNYTRMIYDRHIGDVIFFHTQVVPQIGQSRVIYYVQDAQYYTHIVECSHIWEDANLLCFQQAKYAHSSQIVAFTTAWFTDTEFRYFYFIVFQEDLKKIRVVDYKNQHQLILNITYFGHQEAEVTDIASSNGYLYVLRGAVKTIDVYKLSQCQQPQKCKPHFLIDSDTLKPLGISYFAPVKLITDHSHPEVLFIRCKGSLIILDIDNKERMVVLDEIISEATINSFYRVAVNQKRLVIVSDPDIVDVYSLDHLYIKNRVYYLRRLPLHGHKIQPTSDIEFSDFNTLIYINAVDPAKNTSVVLIYRTDRPSAASLYATIPLRKLYTRPGLEIEVSGFYVDFLNIKTDDGFTIYRVFSHPIYVLKDVQLDFKFNVEFTNPKSNLTSQYLQIQTVNYPSGFNATSELNKTLNNLKLDNIGNYTWDDRKWFVGHILSYNFTCDECGENETSKVHLKEHVDPMRKLHFTSYDYVETLQGGISVYQDLFRWRINGSIHDAINLPDQKYLERCIRVAAAFHSDLVVTACQQLGRGINLYLTTQTSAKPWTLGPYRSTAYNARNLQIAGDIVMVTDVSTAPEFKYHKGAVFLYSLELDNVSGQELDELEAIDENDLSMAHGYTKDYVYIANSHLVFSSADNCYRLYITQVEGGFFVVDFTHQIGRREINILTINYVNMKTLFEKHGDLHMPTDASFQAISLVSYKYNPHFFTETVIVTTKGYHNFEVLLVFDDNGNILNSIIHRVYLRYGFYNNINEVKVSHSYVAISYVIPSAQHQMLNYNRQIVAVYDARDYEDDHEKGYSERYMLGGVRHNKTEPLMFAFNTTYDFRTNGTRIGLVVSNPYTAPNNNMEELSLSRNLTLQLKQDFKTQTLTLIPFSDFEVRSFKMEIINYGKSQSIMTIIIIVLAAVITAGFAIYIVILVRNKRQKKDIGERVSLLTEAETLRNSVEPTAGEYSPPVITPPATEGAQEEESDDEQDEDQNMVQEEKPKSQPIPEAPKTQPVAVEQKPVDESAKQPVKVEKHPESQTQPEAKKQQLPSEPAKQQPKVGEEKSQVKEEPKQGEKAPEEPKAQGQ